MNAVTLPSLVLLLLLALPGCTAPPGDVDVGTLVFDDAPAGDTALRRRPIVAALEGGGMGLVDADVGFVSHLPSRADLSPETHPLRVSDVVWRGPRGPLDALFAHPVDDYGAILRFEFGEPHGWAERAWVDGRARLAALPGGLLVFERGHGERWRVLADDGSPRPSHGAPAPSSVWARGDEVVGLVRPSALAAVALEGAPRVDPLPWPLVEGARAAGHDAGAWIIEPTAHGLRARHTAHAQSWNAPLPTPPERLHQAASLGGWKDGFAVTTTAPARLVVGAVVQGGLVLVEAPLPASPPHDDATFTRHLAVADATRVLVGTVREVVAFDLIRSADGAPLSLVADPHFDGAGLLPPLVVAPPRDRCPGCR